MYIYIYIMVNQSNLGMDCIMMHLKFGGVLEWV